MSASIPQLREATWRAWRHVRDVHGIDAPGSASHIEAAHQAAHRREGTEWHLAWTLDEDEQEEQPR